VTGQDPLAFDADPFEKAFGQLAGPLHWPTLSRDEAVHAFADLRVWVDQLVDRFAIEVRVIPPCWQQHNGMVEALSALRDHERSLLCRHRLPHGRRGLVPCAARHRGSVDRARIQDTVLGS